MLKKETKIKIKRAIAYYNLRIFYFFLRVMPKFAVYLLADFAAWAGYYIAFRYRRIAGETLNIAFGNEKTGAEMKKIARDCLAHMAKGMIEMVAFMDKPEILDKMVTIEGRENLDKALAKGKGVIMISGHFGNFPLLLEKLAILSYKINVMLRKMRDKKADEFFSKKRADVGIKSIYTEPRSECVRKSMEALRNNEIIFMLMDQNFGTGGVFVDFFGKKAATATGPVIFALRSGAPIVPAFIIRKENNTHLLIIEPEMAIEERVDKEEMVVANVAKVTNIIERYVRKYPAEWGWIHRRWKSRPNEQAA